MTFVKGFFMKRLGIILLLGLLSRSSFAFLRASGQEIVDASGQPVLLRGFGLGGRLVPEGYMLHIPGFGSPSSIRKQIVDLVGEENAAAFYREYEANYVSEADIALIASWGFNSIRLPFNYRMLSPESQPGVFLEEGFAVIDQTLRWCEKYRLYLILDLHCAPGGQNAGNISDSDGQVARLWTVKANQDRTVELWRKIAERYANEPWIGGYDLLNEPVLPSGYSNAALRSLYKRIAEAVREVDKNHLLFLEGNWWATDFNQLAPPVDDNMAYSFHKYWSRSAESTIKPYLNLRAQQNVPLWLGESGENSNHWFGAVVQICEKNNVGWNWWAHKKVETVTSPLSAPLGPKYDRVRKYWAGEAAKPSVSAAMDGLMELADNLKLENCTFLPDLIDALTRPDFMTRRLPFKAHIVPGQIAAVDFDLGANNVAYQDANYENTGGSGGAAHNNGWQYRNDGVDIEKCSDPQNARFNIGWIEDGEWQRYSLTAEKSGLYDIEVRVASTGASGQLALQLDGRSLGVLSVPNTGGWQSWRTLALRDVPIERGEHLLTHLAQRGGYNFGLMRFVLKQETGVDRHQQAPADFRLEANFPNPFNTSTVIAFSLPRTQAVRLEVLSLDGRLVKTLADGELPAGRHAVVWNGKNDWEQSVASGVYAVRMSAERVLTRKMVLQK